MSGTFLQPRSTSFYVGKSVFRTLARTHTYDRVARTVEQVGVARLERLPEEIRQCSSQKGTQKDLKLRSEGAVGIVGCG